MIRYSLQELKLVISQLNTSVDVVMFQRSFLVVAYCYSSEEALDLGLLVDRKILELAKR
jgi:hypothetical protein